MIASCSRADSCSTVLGVRRPTRDADLLARGVAGDEETLLAVIREVAGIPVDDGMASDTSRARAMTIREHAAYPGTRIVIPAALGTARLQLRLDVNFGSTLVGPQKIHYPTLLLDEPIDLLGYPVEAVIAEKVETMISAEMLTPASATTLTYWRYPGSTL